MRNNNPKFFIWIKDMASSAYLPYRECNSVFQVIDTIKELQGQGRSGRSLESYLDAFSEKFDLLSAEFTYFMPKL
jgi:hypothetical protein